MNEMRGWNSPVQDVDISEEKLNHFNGGTPCNRYGKYDALNCKTDIQIIV